MNPVDFGAGAIYILNTHFHLRFGISNSYGYFENVHLHTATQLITFLATSKNPFMDFPV
jgi:hypothetical protein